MIVTDQLRAFALLVLMSWTGAFGIAYGVVEWRQDEDTVTRPAFCGPVDRYYGELATTLDSTGEYRGEEPSTLAGQFKVFCATFDFLKERLREG